MNSLRGGGGGRVKGVIDRFQYLSQGILHRMKVTRNHLEAGRVYRGYHYGS